MVTLTITKCQADLQELTVISLNCAGLPTVFMSHDGLASTTRSLQHERTNCNLSTREHWVAAICTSLICTPPSLSTLMLTNRQKRRRPIKWHPYTSQTTRLFTPLTGSKSSTIYDGQIIIVVINSIIISSSFSAESSATTNVGSPPREYYKNRIGTCLLWHENTLKHSPEMVVTVMTWAPWGKRWGGGGEENHMQVESGYISNFHRNGTKRVRAHWSKHS